MTTCDSRVRDELFIPGLWWIKSLSSDFKLIKTCCLGNPRAVLLTYIGWRRPRASYSSWSSSTTVAFTARCHSTSVYNYAGARTSLPGVDSDHQLVIRWISDRRAHPMMILCMRQPLQIYGTVCQPAWKRLATLRLRCLSAEVQVANWKSWNLWRNCFFQIIGLVGFSVLRGSSTQ
jgi:hypothetical protein